MIASLSNPEIIIIIPERRGNCDLKENNRNYVGRSKYTLPSVMFGDKIEFKVCTHRFLNLPAEVVYQGVIE